MKIIYRIALAELQSLFYSPVAWLILIVFTIQCSFAFTGVVDANVVRKAMGYGVGNLTLDIYAGMHGFFKTLQEYLYLYIPLLTMGLMSGELSSGSIKLLYSSPVRNSQIILGKYLSMLVYGLVLIGIICVYVIYSAFVVKQLDVSMVLTGLLGIYLLICAYAAIGLFMSSITSYQVVAAMGTLAIFALLNVIKGIGQNIDFVREITYWLSINGRCNEFVRGMICSEDLLYFLIVIVLFLTLSILRLKAIRQKTPWKISLGKYAAVVIFAVVIGYFSARPSLKCFYDATRTKQQTLTENSQKILSRATGGLTMTTYVNCLDEFSWTGEPANRLYDQRRFEQYTRFKPEIKMKYVYFYDKSQNERLYSLNQGLTDREIMIKLSVAQGLDTNMYLRPEEIKQVIDLSSEDNHVVRVLERENGRKVFLRMFRDMWIYPGEAEVTAAIRQLVDDDLPVVGFLTGHGVRNSEKAGDRDYRYFVQERVYRRALINQGFAIENVNLEDEIPEQVNILVVADMQTALSQEEMEALEKYIARGGNLIVAGDVGRAPVMNPIIASFGVQFMTGQIVQQNKDFMMDLVFAKPQKDLGNLSYMFDALVERVITMPGCVGLEYEQKPGFTIIPLLMSETQGCWNEVETMNFIDEKAELNVKAGEVEQAYPLALALSREIAGKQQKIVILGDADCMSNAEMKANRDKVNAGNGMFILSIFNWMTDGEFPIDVRRPATPDNDLYVGVDGMKITRYAFWGFSLLLLVVYLCLWFHRRGR
ncbi:MAG: Gldg family protein [Sanguibacteroides justesenii]|jgi:hypothetical protein|uniref:Gldg family protein n=1 Tax=Butyricimonas faecalis TaxID=2093856 RepID=UPI001DB52039|nr:Gldg family protein [Sanguibacteroides justesenii]